ncbi:MAG: ATP-dependent RNA helicase HrpA [Polyangiaceae bacterium]
MSEPKVTFPESLPISAHVRELALAIDANPVVVVEGETGSGKTTQLPKICLAMGRGLEKQIGVTEPRRIAATSVAARVASELGVELGREVGCQIRFSNQTSRETYVKFMTDGILLAEIPRDPLLRAYDTIILDEAHERSLNIDFLMGHLLRVLAERSDLRVIISSATMATDRIAAFFRGAPVIRVSGRTFPVETIYAPIDPSEPDVPDAIARVIDDVTALDPRGDVLVFLPGEREIKETANALAHRSLPRSTVLPLFGRLARADQQRVFESTTDRKIILATNVAETSLTIPGVTSVIDTGLARLNRYQARTGVTQLLVEPISRASAEQRKGRAGRTQGGVCFRLYPEEDYRLRSENTDPEILRVGLSGAILQFATLGLGDLRTFPLLDPPPKRAITEGYRVLEELGAITEDEALTPIGRTLARLPLDPRLGRMILAADDEGVRDEVLIIAAALALQDPRERPQGLEAKADQAHRRFRVEGSDFLSLLELFRFYEREATSTRLARKVCRDHFLSFTRMREWLDTRDQIARQYREERERAGRETPRGKRPDAVGDRVHRAVLTGLASRIGMWHAESRTYVGARQTRFALHPSSALAKKPPQWVVVAELVETSRLFGRVAAAIDPAWLAETAAHLVRRSYGESHFAAKRGEAMVKEQATLYGLPIVRDHSVPLAPIDPAAARRCFVLEGLVRGAYEPKTPSQWLAENQAVIDRWNHLRSRARRQGLEVELEERKKQFFEARVPATVCDARAFEAWRKEAEAKDPRALRMTLADLGADGADEVSVADYPDELVVEGMRLPVRYCFDPSEDADGATLEVPIELLADLDPGVFEWTIPGWHERKIAELLHGLPKATQRAFDVPSIDALASRIARRLVPFEGEMRPSLARAVYEETGVRVGIGRFTMEDVPGYLRFHYRVMEHKKPVAESSDLVDLQTHLKERSRAAFGALVSQHGGARAEGRLTRFPARGLSEALALPNGVEAHPAIALLYDGSLELAWSGSRARADAMTRRALPTLFAYALGTSLGALEKKLSGRIEPADRRDVVRRALDEAFELESGPIPRTDKAFLEKVAGGERRLSASLAELGRLALDVASELEPTRRLAKSLVGKPGAPRAALDDVDSQLAHLVPAGYLGRLSRARLAAIPMYLRAIRIRLERLPNGPQKDKAKADTVVPFWTDWLAKRGELLASGAPPEDVEAFHWLVEEFRVAVFAPEAGKPLSLSAKRLSEVWAELAR